MESWIMREQNISCRQLRKQGTMFVWATFILYWVCASAQEGLLRGVSEDPFTGKPPKESNNWPIIGIMAQPSYDTAADCGGSCQYLAASYVKQIESMGARVVPIDYYATNDQLDDIFKGINGLLFPGGGSPFPPGAQYLFDKVVEANDNGDFFPLWGTCMGFQWLLISASRDQNILDPSDGTQMDAYNISLPLEFTQQAPKSRLFGKAPRELVQIFADQNVTMNNHHYGIWTDHFAQTESLTDFYSVLSTNADRNGDEFVSTIEAKRYPIYGSQWHPEKAIFEWGRDEDGTPMEAINHSEDSLKANSYPGEFLVRSARRNKHAFPSVEEESHALIYNYKPTYVGYPGGPSTFEQKYYFHWGSEDEVAQKRRPLQQGQEKEGWEMDSM